MSKRERKKEAYFPTGLPFIFTYYYVFKNTSFSKKKQAPANKHNKLQPKTKITNKPPGLAYI